MPSAYVGPYIDESIEHVGVSRLRTLNATNLRNIGKTFVIQDNDKPLAVLLSYEQFLAMQRHLVSVVSTLEMFSNTIEISRFKQGLNDLGTGNQKSFDDVERDLVEKP